MTLLERNVRAERVVDLRKQGMKLREIAEAVGTYACTVSMILRREGVVGRTAPRSIRTWKLKHEDEIRDGLAAGKTYTELAQELELTRQCVQQKAKRLGVKSVNPKGPRPVVRAQRELERPEGELAELWDEAQGRGFKVRRVIGDSLVPDATRLQIDGKICRLHVLENVFIPPGAKSARYCRLTGPGTQVDFDIVRIPGSWFVFPGGMFEAKAYYLPLEPARGYNGMHSRIDWEEYRGAWERLV